MIEIRPDSLTDQDVSDKISIFLAGSIEQGKADFWQKRIVDGLSGIDCAVFNPRRSDWDDSWDQDPTKGTKFYNQVDWEISHLDKADLLVFYFDPNTKSPITLLELGYCLKEYKFTYIYCPKTFWRYGNVKFMADKFGYVIAETESKLIEAIKIGIATKEIMNKFVDLLEWDKEQEDAKS